MSLKYEMYVFWYCFNTRNIVTMAVNILMQKHIVIMCVASLEQKSPVIFVVFRIQEVWY